MKPFISFILLVLLVSCSNMRYISNGSIPTYVGKKEFHHDYFEFQGEKKFFLWGLSPSEQVVELDKIASNQGMVSAANFSIREYQTFGNMLMTFFTLGLITPISYEVKGFGVLQRDDRDDL